MRQRDYSPGSYLSRSFHTLRDVSGRPYATVGSVEAHEGIVRVDQYDDKGGLVILRAVVRGKVHMREIEGRVYTQRGLITLARRYINELASLTPKEDR